MDFKHYRVEPAVEQAIRGAFNANRMAELADTLDMDVLHKLERSLNRYLEQAVDTAARQVVRALEELQQEQEGKNVVARSRPVSTVPGGTVAPVPNLGDARGSRPTGPLGAGGDAGHPGASGGGKDAKGTGAA